MGWEDLYGRPGVGRGDRVPPAWKRDEQDSGDREGRPGITSQSLLCLWEFAHGSQAAGADVYVAFDAINFQTTFVYIEYKAAARALLREIRIIAVQWLPFTYFTTT